MRKTVALILACLLAITVFSVVSCDNTPKESGKKTNSPGDTAQTGTVAPTTPEEEKWPEVKFEDGTTLSILGRAYANTDWYAEELLEEAVNDAVYERNEWLKNNHNFEIVFTQATNDDEWLATARDTSKAGTDAYNFFVGSGKNMSIAAQENLLLDMAKLENINLDAEWWDDNATHDLSIANRVFMTSGAIQTSDIRSVYCIFMNKTVLEEKEDYADPYQLVRDGKWTMDNMLSIMKDYANDENGDGKMDTNDKWGYTCENYDGYAMFFCSGERIVNKDENDLPILTLNTPRTIEFIQKMKEFYTNESVMVGYSATIIPISKDNRALFCGTILNAIGSYREMTGDYGILPMPMYEENQERFSHTVSVCTTGSLVGIPASVEDTDKTSMMVELLARKSLTTLRTAYLDATVISRGLRDEDSLEMLNIIIGSRVYDVAYMNMWGPKQAPGGVYGWMMYFYNISGTPANADKFASTYDSAAESTQKDIDATVEAYQSHFE